MALDLVANSGDGSRDHYKIRSRITAGVIYHAGYVIDEVIYEVIYECISNCCISWRWDR